MPQARFGSFSTNLYSTGRNPTLTARTNRPLTSR